MDHLTEPEVGKQVHVHIYFISVTKLNQNVKQGFLSSLQS